MASDGANLEHVATNPKSNVSTTSFKTERYIPLASDVTKSINFRLLKKERDLLDAEDALEETKDDVRDRLDKVEIRRGFLRNREKQYFASLLTFEDMLVQTDMEWMTITKQLNAEHAVRETRLEQATELRNQSDVAERKKDILNGFVQKYGPAQTFVLNVINMSEEYEKVKDVSDEYACLRYAYEELSQSEAVLQIEMDASRRKEIKFFSIQNGRKLAHDIFIELLNTLLGQLKFDMVDLGDTFFTTSEMNLVQKIDLGRIHMGIEHMFSLVCKKQLFVLKSPRCHLEMLKKIGEFIVDWSDVVKEVTKIVAEQKHRKTSRKFAYERRKNLDVLAL